MQCYIQLKHRNYGTQGFRKEEPSYYHSTGTGHVLLAHSIIFLKAKQNNILRIHTALSSMSLILAM